MPSLAGERSHSTQSRARVRAGSALASAVAQELGTRAAAFCFRAAAYSAAPTTLATGPGGFFKVAAMALVTIRKKTPSTAKTSGIS